MGDVVNLDTGYLNDGTPWSDQDVLDLKWQAKHGRPLKEAALFLMRHPANVAKKANELGVVFEAESVRSILNRIEDLKFECEAGPLENSQDWQDLKARLKEAGLI